MILVPASRERRTVFRVYPDALRAGKVWIWHRLAALDVVRSHVARGRRLNAGTRERLWGVYVRGYFFFGGEGVVKVSIYVYIYMEETGDMPEVTIVHPRADGELPASICASSAFAPGRAIGPPSMTASSKRTMAAFSNRIAKKNI